MEYHNLPFSDIYQISIGVFPDVHVRLNRSQAQAFRLLSSLAPRWVRYISLWKTCSIINTTLSSNNSIRDGSWISWASITYDIVVVIAIVRVVIWIIIHLIADVAAVLSCSTVVSKIINVTKLGRLSVRIIRLKLKWFFRSYWEPTSLMISWNVWLLQHRDSNLT